MVSTSPSAATNGIYFAVCDTDPACHSGKTTFFVTQTLSCQHSFECSHWMRNRAILRVRREAYETLWYHIERYVNHSEQVMRHSAAYQSARINDSRDKAQKFIQWIMEQTFNLPGLLGTLKGMKTHLFAILPHPQNPSYESSLNKLQAILDTARHIEAWSESHPIE